MKAEINLSNNYSKGVKFQLKPLPLESPFKVMFNKSIKSVLIPGLNLQLIVEFTPKSLDSTVEEIIIVTEDGNRLLIPLIAYLEPPVLKTHKDIDELTNVTPELITSSYIECGACFTGDTKVTKLKFRCYQGSGEFFIMSSENWINNYINTVTSDNLLEIPPFRVYPVFFKIKKDEVIDLFVEFMPKTSGTHMENIIIACDNGEIRSLDLLADAVGWHSYYFSFQDSLLKDLPVEKDDDIKVKHFIDFYHTTPNGKVEKVFSVSNNSDLAFEFQWKIREANIVSSSEKYSKLWKYEVKIDPESGTFEPKSVWEFLVTIEFNNAEISKYRMVLSLYVLNLPYQCIEEDATIIQPTGLVRNLYSQSLYGEEEASLVSPELASLQGTYESLQESIKSYAEYQSKTLAAPRSDFCRTVCIPNPGLCAKPLKKSKTFFNIGEGDNVGCVCRMKPVASESVSESCVSNTRDDKIAEMSPQRNDVTWDFVDILVDEIELWVEVVPTRVTLEPSIINLNNPLKVNDCPVYKKVIIRNHNQCPVTCTWAIQSESPSKNNSLSDQNKSSSNSFFLLFEKKTENKNGETFKDPDSGYAGQSEDATMSNSHLNFQRFGKIFIKPSNSFTVPGSSEFICEIGISAGQAGKIRETLILNVNKGDLNLQLLIVGKAVAKSFRIPDIIDFGVLRQGSRNAKDFKIFNENSSPLFWKINQYTFSFEEDRFLSGSESKAAGHMKKTKGVTKGKSAVQPFCLDARAPGLKFLLLEVEENNAELQTLKKQATLVLGDVKVPNLDLSTPRFANAILSPPGVMYIGRKISTQVTLTNKSKVETFISWGHSFGCHCRKIKLDISPKSSRIEKQQKLTINIDITALDQGIINHCYVPCFFCRSTVPLILSIVGIAETLNVTFEVVDYPMQTHADPRTFFKSPFYHTVLRVPWPARTYHPTLGLKYLNEVDILNMKCQCLEVEEEAARAFGELKQSLGPELGDLNNNLPSSKNSGALGEASCEGSYISLLKTEKTEDAKLPSPNLSGSCSLESKKSNESSVIVYSSCESSNESLKSKRPHLEFLCVPYQTPILRQFVIRNETPIETSFQIGVCTFGMSNNLPDRRLEIVKNRVLGSSKDDFQYKLMKNQPLVVVVEPTKGELKSFDAVCINVQCYGNTWGEYRDYLVCQINGIEPFHLKMFIQILGHPIHFPIFKTQNLQKPVLRFQPITFIEQSATKQIKVVNRSCIPLTIAWMVFLTKPLSKEEEREDGYSLSSDSNVNFESHHSEEESAQSSKNYIPKNASESVPSLSNASEMKDSRENYDPAKSLKRKPSSVTSSTKKIPVEDKINFSSMSIDEAKSDTQQIQFPGRFDTRIFQVNPKELHFEPFEEKEMTITFCPQFSKLDTLPQEFTGILAGCVKLKPEDELCPELYCRPCGIRFVSEIMDFNAVVEIPIVSFEILKGDLKFIVDSNEVLKSKTKSVLITKSLLIKNRNQNSVFIKIKMDPGVVFKIQKVDTLDKVYTNYNPDLHVLKIEPGHLFEMELECLVTYKDVMYAFEQLTLIRKKEKHSFTCGKVIEPSNDLIRKQSGVCNKDGLDLNIHRMSSRSDNSTCSYDMETKNMYGETEGESFLPPEEEVPCKPKPLKHTTIIRERIRFVQSGLVTQSLMAELHVSFPAIRVSPSTLDFGNVYLGETAVRYCTFINLTGLTTEFKIVPACNNKEFDASPLTGCLPPTDYKSDIGRTITINFKPTKPGHFKKSFNIYCNSNLEFDSYELFASGFGTWNEKYKSIKYETYTKLEGPYHQLSK